MVTSEELNHSFLFNMIRKYNRCKRQTQKDVVLHSVGVHAQLDIERQRSLLPTLTEEERETVLNFLRNFLDNQKVDAKIKN